MNCWRDQLETSYTSWTHASTALRVRLKKCNEFTRKSKQVLFCLVAVEQMPLMMDIGATYGTNPRYFLIRKWSLVMKRIWTKFPVHPIDSILFNMYESTRAGPLRSQSAILHGNNKNTLNIIWQRLLCSVCQPVLGLPCAVARWFERYSGPVLPSL